MTAFIEERLLDAVAYGTRFGPTYKTSVQPARNDATTRIPRRSFPLYKSMLLYQRLTNVDHSMVIAAFHACAGRAIGFRVKDWSDFKAENQFVALGTGSPQTVQLVKRYFFGPATRVRPIRKPVAGSLVMTGGDVSAISLDPATGLVTFTATLGEEVTASFEFDVPMCFDTDELITDFEEFDALTADVPLIQDTRA